MENSSGESKTVKSKRSWGSPVFLGLLAALLEELLWKFDFRDKALGRCRDL